MSNLALIRLNGVSYPVYTDQTAADVVDQLIYAADEAAYVPGDPKYGGDVGQWAEDTALVFIARASVGGERFDVV
jgi:hypothetical protein